MSISRGNLTLNRLYLDITETGMGLVLTNIAHQHTPPHRSSTAFPTDHLPF